MTDTVNVPLLPCPFCGSNLSIRKGVNPYGHCPTEGCHSNRAQIVCLDIPEQVASWNNRATLAAAPKAEPVSEPDTLEHTALVAELHDYFIADRRKKSLTIPKELGRRLTSALSAQQPPEAPKAGPVDSTDPDHSKGVVQTDTLTASDELLEALPKTWELSWGEVDDFEGSDHEWRVHERRGNVNDREWVLLAHAPNLSDAIRLAKHKGPQS